MNKTSLLMLVVGTILGIVIGYVTFPSKPAPSEFNIEADGFLVKYADGKVNYEIFKRIDGENVEVFKKIILPVEGFVKVDEYSKEVIDDLVSQGILKPTSDNAETDNSSTDE